jgi:uncharacterized protein involved in exopolysaccharide biosynthesis
MDVDAKDEIVLIDLLATLLRRKVLIISITTLAFAAVILYSVFSLMLPPEKSYLPNQYSPKALMLINDSSSSGGGLSSLISSSGLGSLASLAGVDASSGSTYSALAVYLIGTNTFLDSVVDKFGLIERYKIKKFVRAESRKILSKKLSAAYDEDSGVFAIRFTDVDPVFAQSVVNYCVSYMEQRFTEMGLDKNKLQKENLEKNIDSTYKEILKLDAKSKSLDRYVARGVVSDGSVVIEASQLQLEMEAQKAVYTQLKTQYEILKVTMASESPVFQVLELAEVPDQKSGPSRGKLCIVVTFAAFFCSIFLVFALNVIESVKKDPTAMAKLKGTVK